MTAQQFIEKRISELKNFAINMENLGYQDEFEERWMELYLDWTEWTDPIMKELCWKHDQP